MSHIAIGQSGARATQRSGSQQRQGAHVSDLVIASAAAQAAQAMPAVLELSPGLVTQAATYGPERRRVVGVVVRRSPPVEPGEPAKADDLPADLIALEVHVVLSAAQCDSALAASRSALEENAGEPAPPAVLHSIANQIRETTREAVRAVAPTPEIQVDVFIDDLR